MARAITVSCNAYFAQLGVFGVGANALAETAKLLEIPTGDFAEFKQMLPFSAYGQGPVVITPFKMARVVATIADGGEMPEGRWVLDDSNTRTDPPLRILATGTGELHRRRDAFGCGERDGAARNGGLERQRGRQDRHRAGK